MLNVILWRVHNIYAAVDCFKVSTNDMFNYSEVKNIISVNNNVYMFTMYSSELQVDIWILAMNRLSFLHDLITYQLSCMITDKCK